MKNKLGVKIELIGGRYCGGFSHAKPTDDTVVIPVTNEMTNEATGKFLVYKRLDKKRFLFDHAFSDQKIELTDGPCAGQKIQVNNEDVCVIIGPNENGQLAAYKRDVNNKWAFYKIFSSTEEADAFTEEVKKGDKR
jgi:hypothetical protein